MMNVQIGPKNNERSLQLGPLLPLLCANPAVDQGKSEPSDRIFTGVLHENPGEGGRTAALPPEA